MTARVSDTTRVGTARRRWSRRAWLALLGLGCLHGAARADAFVTSIPAVIPTPPPLRPDGEKLAPDHPGFRASCLALIPILRKNIRLDRTLTTQTKTWGLVLRVDFSMLTDSTVSGDVNRLVFWKGAGGTPFVVIAVGEQIPPLPPDAATAAATSEASQPH